MVERRPPTARMVETIGALACSLCSVRFAFNVRILALRSDARIKCPFCGAWMAAGQGYAGDPDS